MPDGRGESTKGIEALEFLSLKINMLWLIACKKRAVLSRHGPSFMRKPLRYKESKIGKTSCRAAQTNQNSIYGA